MTDQPFRIPLPRREPSPLDESLRELQRRLDASFERVAFIRDDTGEWQCRTMSGDVGRGNTLLEAILELLEQLPEPRRP